LTSNCFLKLYYKSWKNVGGRSKQPGVWITAFHSQLAKDSWSSELMKKASSKKVKSETKGSHRKAPNMWEAMNRS
jgi:hypothetical protein